MKRLWCIFFSLTLPVILLSQNNKLTPGTQKVIVEWNSGKHSGTIEVLNGHLKNIAIVNGKGKIKANFFEISSNDRARIAIDIDNINNNFGPGATLISIRTTTSPFSFFLRDVNRQFPVYIPEFSVVVLEESDHRSFEEVQSDLLSRKLQTKLQKIESEPEESFSAVEKLSGNKPAPTWLGISKDFRIFQINETMPDVPEEANMITPLLSSTSLFLPDISTGPVLYSYTLGRGVSPEIKTIRRLENGVLPILHSTHLDEDIEYYSTTFVSMENSSLSKQSVYGTPYLVADAYSGGHRFTKEQEEKAKSLTGQVLNTNEQTVLYFRSEISNKGSVPRYAWFRTIKPESVRWFKYPFFILPIDLKCSYDTKTGLSGFSRDSIFCVSKLNGKPLPNEEMAILLQPGETAIFEFYLPHSPIPNDRAFALAKQSFDEKLEDCKTYWQTKLKNTAQIKIPEKRIEEMIQAGLLHLDIVTYGEEPKGSLAPTVGVYAPIGTESAPIIQFYNSMGWPEIAKRSLNFFFDKQHDDGLMINFGGYMVETGAVLWSLGEYFRYTQDKEWIEQIKPKILKSCDFLLQWREKNKIESLREGKGYGMINGKVADPNDNFHQFMLNGYAFLGLSRVSEILTQIDPSQSARLRKEAEDWKKDIRDSFFMGMALSPVVPLGDGSWNPTAPPWAEITGPRALYVNKEKFYSHGTFTVPDILLGPMYLVFCEVLDIDEPASKMMLEYQDELFYYNSVVFSQPYYSRHNWMQARLGSVKPFLKTYYNTFAAIADRETYTFWEALYKYSTHKTHEEAWFLMETRWMLYLEDKTTLRLMSTIPRKWLENGNVIELNNVQSYFGSLNIKVNSAISQGYIEAEIQCNSEKKPEVVTIRLPHPDNKKALCVTGGDYNPVTETVTINSFNGKSKVKIEF